jgi:large subunit ribosomal protein L6
MSKIGKQPINIPNEVGVKINDGFVIIKGLQGEIKIDVPQEIKVEEKGSQIFLSPAARTKKINALWGLARSLIANAILGAKDGFSKQLEIQGVGYRASVSGNKLVLNLGFSHPVEVEAPQGINFKVEKNIISVSGADKRLVSQTAAIIRAKKKPEPYKGKGIRYAGEVVRRKAGKKVAASA